MESFDAYGVSFAMLAVWALMLIGLSMQSTIGRTAENRAPSGKPIRNYADKAYRRERAFANAVETSGAFIAATVAAIMAGASPIVVNVLTVVFILSRIAMAVVHIQTENQPLRSATFGVGWLCLILLSVMALWAVLS